MDSEKKVTDEQVEKAEQALQNGIKNRVSLKELTRLYTAFIYKAHDCNKVHASRVLDVNRRTLQRWQEKSA